MSTHEPIEFTIESTNDGFTLAMDGVPIRTSIGDHLLIYPAEDLLRHIIDEFCIYPQVQVTEAGVVVDPTFFGSYRLYGFQKEWIETSRDNVTENFTYELLSDGFWTRLPGPEAVDQVNRYRPVLGWLTTLGAQWADRDFVVIPEVWESMYMEDSSTETFLQSRDILQSTFETLDPEQKSVCVYLHNALQGNLTHAMALAIGAISPIEFAVGTLATQAIFIAMPDVDAEGLTEDARAIADDAATALDYIHKYRSGTAIQRLLGILQTGEATDIEFKSTLRYDIRAQTKNRAITDAVIKTIAGFINTSGGSLVIGVNDDAQPVGIEMDGFDNDDHFLRHLYTSITNALGPAAAPLVSATPVKHAGKTVVLVECQRGTRLFPSKKKNESPVIYVRTGPATITLTEEQAAEWEAHHRN